MTTSTTAPPLEALETELEAALAGLEAAHLRVTASLQAVDHALDHNNDYKLTNVVTRAAADEARLLASDDVANADSVPDWAQSIRELLALLRSGRA